MRYFTTFILYLIFNQEGLDLLRATNQEVTIIKAVGCSVSATPVIWVAFKPTLYNTITWTEGPVAYGLYASRNHQNGVISDVVADTNIVIGDLHNLSTSLQFDEPTTSSNPTAYTVINNSGGTLNFGLTQTANFNGVQVEGSPPLNAAFIPNGQTAQFIPITTLSVGVSVVINGVVQTSSIRTVVQYSATTTEHTVTFNATSSTFKLTD